MKIKRLTRVTVLIKKTTQKFLKMPGFVLVKADGLSRNISIKRNMWEVLWISSGKVRNYVYGICHKTVMILLDFLILQFIRQARFL